jgi:hypothetical protein
MSLTLEEIIIERLSVPERIKLIERIRDSIPQGGDHTLTPSFGAAGTMIALTPDEQLAFWNALNQPVRLTVAQRRLGKLARDTA